MARIRTIKPRFFRHEGLFEAEQQSGLPLRLAFAGLFTVADREGRFRWEPRTLKLDCLPYDEVDFAKVMDALAHYGFVLKYQINGESFGCIPTWKKHQVINQREAKSELPEPNDEMLAHARTCTHEPEQVHFNGEGKGREEEGKGIVKRADARAVLPFEGDVIRLKEKHFTQWQQNFTFLDLKAELTARDAWLAGPDATDRDRQNWFISTSKYLANRNAEAKARGSPAARGDDVHPAEIYGNLQ